MSDYFYYLSHKIGDVILKNAGIDHKVNLWAWLIWLLGSVFVFYKYIIEVSPSVLGMNMMSYYQLSGSYLGLLIAAYFISNMAMQIPMGLLLDRYGPKAMMSICILLCALGSLWLGHAHAFWAAFLARFITGIGAAAAVIGCMKLISMWFSSDRFALMVGLMMSLGMLGAVFGEMPLDYIIHLKGWQGALRYIALGGFVLFVLFVLIVRERKLNNGNKDEHPPLLQSLKAIINNPQSWWLSLFSGLAFAPVSAFGGAWGVPFLQAVDHLNSADAATAISAIFYGFALGAPFWGWLSDRFQRRLVLIQSSVGVATICSLLLVILSFKSLLLLFLLFFIFGFGISAFVLSFSMIREVNYLIYAASAVGFMNMFNSLTSAGIDPLIGYSLDVFSHHKMQHNLEQISALSYRLSMGVAPVILIVACVLLFFIKETFCKQRVRQD